MRLLRLTPMLLLVGCAALAGMAAAAPPADDWPVSTPEEQGMDSAVLAKMLDIVQQRGMTYHSIVIVRNGVLVLDANFYPYDPAVPHELASTTKSITGTLVGIAIQQGYIESVDQPALDFFPEVTNPSPEQQAMTIRHLLTMTSGLMCGNETWAAQPDPVAYIWAQPRWEMPPANFFYCNRASHLLSAIVTRATGMPTQDFARANLFEPLGITDWV